MIAEIPYINIAKKSRISSKDRMLLDNAFRALGIQLGLYNSAQKCRSIMVTSSIPEEGKSFVSENLARTLSALGKKVVLIDTDFLRPKITQNHGLVNKLGLLDFFKGDAELNEIKYPILSNENLMVVSTGRNFKNYLSVLDTQKFQILLEYFKRENDFIIIDSAPVNIVSDYGFFAPYMNNTLLVVRHKFTPETVLENLGKVNILDKLVEPRIVFNYVKNSGVLQKGANYGYQYYNQSHYGVKS